MMSAHRVAVAAAACFALLLGFAFHTKLRGEILNNIQLPTSASSLVTAPVVVTGAITVDGSNDNDTPTLTDNDNYDDDDNKDAKSYYIFLQKFPLESSFRMIFHTEVIVCPRQTFASDIAFLNLLDGLVANILSPSRFDTVKAMTTTTAAAGNNFQDTDTTTKVPFISIEREYWSKQSEPGCVQLGYGGADCDNACCGSPHRRENTNYALNSQQAVIGNAMGEYKELYLYGMSGGGSGSDMPSTTANDGSGGNDGISGEDAYKAVCHGHMNAIEIGRGKFPICVSNWSGHDYNPLTNNCNTFTSTILKCVYGLSDAKPHLGVSDLRTVTCPTETNANGMDVEQCMIPVDGAGMEDASAGATLLALQ
ncbi:hypothetical protein ACHAWU_003047 [Discostella pseudostelligera]|uniref:Uncharacterized protein n=1 Tax=Discostella pseudostelligera TaxID=259834 RepID=A0ABD3MAJ8_9STRA